MESIYPLINLKKYRDNEKFTFEFYIRRVLSQYFDIISLPLKFSNHEIIWAGEDLYLLYKGYKEGKIITPKRWHFYIYKNTQNLPLYYNKIEDPFFQINPVSKVTFKKPFKYRGFTLTEIETKGIALDSLANALGSSINSLAYGLKSKKLILTESFNEFIKTNQLTCNSTNASIDTTLKYFLKDFKKNECFCNFGIELNILGIVGFYRNETSSNFINILSKNPDKFNVVTNELIEIFNEINLFKFSQLISSSSFTLEFLLRIYYTGGLGLKKKIKTLSNYPNTFEFIFRLSDGNINIFKNFMKEEVSTSTLNFIEKIICHHEIKYYFKNTNFTFATLSNDLIIYKPLLKKYKYLFFETVYAFCQNNPQKRLNPLGLHETLSGLIANGSLKAKFKLLNNPIGLNNVVVPKNVKVKELLTKRALENEGREMDNCLSYAQYDLMIIKGEARLFSIMIDTERFTLCIGMEKRQEIFNFNVIEVKGLKNSEPTPIAKRVAKHITQTLTKNYNMENVRDPHLKLAG